MNAIRSIECRLHEIPLAEVLTDAKHGAHTHFELLTATVTTDDGDAGTGYTYTDYLLFGPFQWARSVSPVRLLEPDDPMYAWRERMLDLFEGMPRATRGYPVWA